MAQSYLSDGRLLFGIYRGRKRKRIIGGCAEAGRVGDDGGGKAVILGKGEGNTRVREENKDARARAE